MIFFKILKNKGCLLLLALLFSACLKKNKPEVLQIRYNPNTFNADLAQIRQLHGSDTADAILIYVVGRDSAGYPLQSFTYEQLYLLSVSLPPPPPPPATL